MLNLAKAKTVGSCAKILFFFVIGNLEIRKSRPDFGATVRCFHLNIGRSHMCDFYRNPHCQECLDFPIIASIKMFTFGQPQVTTSDFSLKIFCLKLKTSFDSESCSSNSVIRISQKWQLSLWLQRFEAKSTVKCSPFGNCQKSMISYWHRSPTWRFATLNFRV